MNVYCPSRLVLVEVDICIASTMESLGLTTYQFHWMVIIGNFLNRLHASPQLHIEHSSFLMGQIDLQIWQNRLPL